MNTTLLIPFKKIYIGFSGGLDSCVLLHQLSQFHSIHAKLTAIHINHGLSPHANDWEVFAKKTAQSLNISFQSFSIILEKTSNLEESARNARYEIFTSLLQDSHDVLVLAHHQNDQAETMLMHLFRGAGVDGLAAMPEWRTLGKGKIYRPFLNLLRTDLEDYAAEKKLNWIDDESNNNLHFDRNFLRAEIIPALQKRWPGLIKNLCRSAEHCAAAKQFIDTEMDKILPEMVDEKQRLSIKSLLSYPRDTQCFLLREWLVNQHFKTPNKDKITRILDELILAKPDSNPIVSWKEGKVRRYQGFLYAISPPSWREAPRRGNPDNDAMIQKKIAELKKQYPNANIDIRFRQGGETMRLHGQTHTLKNLFQEWKIPPWERDQIPLIYKDDVLVEVIFDQ
jgi:tRNA(Ile)-lysidine synthase